MAVEENAIVMSCGAYPLWLIAGDGRLRHRNSNGSKESIGRLEWGSKPDLLWSSKMITY